MGVSLEWGQVFGIADSIRLWLPWQWRPFVSNWLVWSAMLALLSAILLLLHFVFKEDRKIDWDFEKSGYPVRAGLSVDNDIRTYPVGSLVFSGENISGHALHQVDASITLMKDGRRIPLQVLFPSGGPGSPADIEFVPPKAALSLCSLFQPEEPHFPGVTGQITTDEFLRDIGGFTLDISIDGDARRWTFTVDDLREQFERQIRANENAWLESPLNRPVVKRRRATP
jgi:hypothetical protein